jgi:hypothetical protein
LILLAAALHSKTLLTTATMLRGTDFNYQDAADGIISRGHR